MDRLGVVIRRGADGRWYVLASASLLLHAGAALLAISALCWGIVVANAIAPAFDRFDRAQAIQIQEGWENE